MKIEDTFSQTLEAIPVLEYATPAPPQGMWKAACDACEFAVDFVGGVGSALFIATASFIGFGLSIHGIVGTVMILIGACFFQATLRHWSRSSRW